MSPRAASDAVIPGIAALSVGHPGTEAPEGWMWVRLTEVARLETGHTPSRKHPEYWSGDIPWVSLPDARKHHGSVIFDTSQHTNELGLQNSAARLLPADTVCLSRTASVGYVFLLGKPMATSQDFVNWVCSDALDPRFLMYALLAEGDHIRDFGKGSTHTTIYFPEVLAFHICLPPLSEQRRIVETVEALFARVDAVRELLVSATKNTRRVRRSLATAAAAGNLSSAEDSKTTKPLAELLNEPLANGRSVVDGPVGFPVLRLNCITEGGIDLSKRKIGFWSADQARPFLIKQGDFLVVRGNGSLKLVGRGSLVAENPDPVAYPDTLIRVRTRSEQIDPRFLAMVWSSPEVRDQIEATARTTAGIHKISQRDLKELELPYFPLSIQKEIVRRHDELIGFAEAVENRLAMTLNCTERLRKSILSKAFVGEIVTTEAELARQEGRTYELASDLLDRIRRERTASARPHKLTKARRRN